MVTNFHQLKSEAIALPVNACIFSFLGEDGEFYGLDRRWNEINRPKLYVGTSYKMNLFLGEFSGLRAEHNSLLVLHQGKGGEVSSIFPSKAFGREFSRRDSCFVLPVTGSLATVSNVFLRFKDPGTETFLFILSSGLSATLENFLMEAPKVAQIDSIYLSAILSEISGDAQLYISEFELTD